MFPYSTGSPEAAWRYIPLVVENVRGAQPWVGRAKANFGSYYLWGDVGMVGRRVVAGIPRFGVSVAPVKATKVPGFRFDGVSHGSFQTASVEAQKRNPDGTEHAPGSWFKVADSKQRGAKTPAGNCTAVLWKDREVDVMPIPTPGELERQGFQTMHGVKSFTPNGEPLGKNTLGRKFGSKSKARKAASALIAKIPLPLSRHIAQCFK